MPPRIMPKIMYGTAWKKDRTTDLVYQALKAGFRGVDTACQPKVGLQFLGSWGPPFMEDLVGAGIRKAISGGILKRDELFIQTKFTSLDGQDRSQPLPYDAKSSVTQQVTQSVAASLRNLGVGRIDSIVLHGPLRTREQTLEAYRTLESFVQNGSVGQLGISNIYEAEELQWLIDNARIPVTVVQNRWYEGNGWDWDVYDLCQVRSIRYHLATKYGLTPEQTVYKLCQLWNITPLCGSTSPEHVKEALSVELMEALSRDTTGVQALWRLMRGEQ